MRIGLYQPYWGDVGGGQRYLAAVAEFLARAHDVEMVHHREEFAAAAVAEAIDVDLSHVAFRFAELPPRRAPSGLNPLARLRAESEWCAEFSKPYDAFVYCGNGVPIFCHAPRGALITFFPETTREQFQGRTTQAWRERPAPVRAAARAYQRLEWRRRFAGYQKVITCSEFSRRWLKQLWSMNAEVVYPPLRPGLNATTKEPTILAIGRFDASRHKRQDVLVEAFKQLCDHGVVGWRLRLIGSVASGSDARGYVEWLRRQATDYPISIETNVSAATLHTSLETAAILWHAMGYGVDAESQPGKLEHFGMVATEAMAAGCVPVLFHGGGLPESVTDGANGFLWRDRPQLVALTQRLIDDAGLRRRMSAKSLARAISFSHDAFEARLRDIIQPIVKGSRKRSAASKVFHAST